MAIILYNINNNIVRQYCWLILIIILIIILIMIFIFVHLCVFLFCWLLLWSLGRQLIYKYLSQVAWASQRNWLERGAERPQKIIGLQPPKGVPLISSQPYVHSRFIEICHDFCIEIWYIIEICRKLWSHGNPMVIPW